MIHVTVATLVERNGQFLIVEESPAGSVQYNQPAGHWEAGETIVDAAQRETLEETGFTVNIEYLIGIYQCVINGNTYFRHGFFASIADYDPHYTIDPDINAVHWMDKETLLSCKNQHRSPLVQQLVTDYLDNQRYSLALFRSSL